MPDEFTDQAPGVAGTSEDAMHLDALVVGQSYFYNGIAPGAAATLGQSFGAIEVVLSTSSTSALKVNVAAATATVPANSDTYLDVTTAGTYMQTSVTIGAAPPATAAGALRVWKITSGGSAVVSVTLLAPTQPLNVTQIQNAATVAGTIPASSAGAPNGVATLNGSALVVQDPASKGQANGVARLDSAKNLIIEAGQKIVAPGQTGNANGATIATNQAVGIFQNNGAMTVDGRGGYQVTISNSLVTANSLVKVYLVGLASPTPPSFNPVGFTFWADGYATGTFFLHISSATAPPTGMTVAYEIIN